MSLLSADLCPNGCSARGVCVMVSEVAECICDLGWMGSDCSSSVASSAATADPAVVTSGCSCWIPWFLVFVLLGLVGSLFGCWYHEWAARHGLVVDKNVVRRRRSSFVPRDEVTPSAPPV
ncbi:hypothetical protein GCK72_011586 [Caenorhabditis remanei]|uniref:EGF-like domain-containing protein n=1 Tax=Caenorhabditis remanei TaxID=31234 RepID=A0A6A5H669_CAERE|nr:hypothetical protein GCK72_011586 [Caenorhabditis remanei]KAF1763320.1 hypothetical protein GCK72_011586 [Caenorhabditis remanei]